MYDGGEASRNACGIGGDPNVAGKAGGQGIELLQEIGALDGGAIFIHVDGVGGESGVPNLAIAEGDGVKESLILGAKQLDRGLGGDGGDGSEESKQKKDHHG